MPVNKFVITKQLTKQPEDYPDAKNQPHVQVALRRKAAGKRNGVAAGETVPYIICINQAVAGEEGAGEAAPVQKSLAERAYHPEELRSSDSLVVDAEYYLGQQVHPVVSRLCSPIEGTNPGHLAECLGLDSSRCGLRVPCPPCARSMRPLSRPAGTGRRRNGQDPATDADVRPPTPILTWMGGPRG